jgi:hypothetical protein
MQRQFYHATGQGSAAIAAAQPAPRIGVGDRVRIFDALYGQYFWHVVTETLSGAHPRIKVDAYDCYISASLVNGHRKGRK